ncbi:cell wall hydrolase [Oricola thermophila]|nr:cell wall hydrolase [Oricola thermophila]
MHRFATAIRALARPALPALSAFAVATSAVAAPHDGLQVRFTLHDEVYLAAAPDALAAEVPKAEIECLATAIYFEARSEPVPGQEAVAQVILNRKASDTWPDTICGVVFQNAHRRNACQFSFACDGQPDVPRERKAWQRAKEIAGKILFDRDVPAPVLTATHYHADYVRPYWASSMKRLSKIGRHIFYRG